MLNTIHLQTLSPHYDHLYTLNNCGFMHATVTSHINSLNTSATSEIVEITDRYKQVEMPPDATNELLAARKLSWSTSTWKITIATHKLTTTKLSGYVSLLHNRNCPLLINSRLIKVNKPKKRLHGRSQSNNRQLCAEQWHIKWDRVPRNPVQVLNPKSHTQIPHSLDRYERNDTFYRCDAMPALSVARPCPSVTSQGSIKTAQQIKLFLARAFTTVLSKHVGH